MTKNTRGFLFAGLLLLFFIPLHLLCHDVTIIAHRGNSSEAPENTLASFQSAVANGIPFLECDIHLTKDDVPIIVHDQHLHRTANTPSPMAVEDLTLEQIKTFDAGLWFGESFRGQKILTLWELLTSPLNEIGLMLEIKEGSAPPEKLAKAVVEQLLPSLAENKDREILIGSISPEILTYVKALTHQPTIAIVVAVDDIEPHRKANPDQYALNKEIVSNILVEEIHQEGKKVWVWTVNEPEEMSRLLDMRVDGIITNRPATMKQELNE